MHVTNNLVRLSQGGTIYRLCGNCVFPPLWGYMYDIRTSRSKAGCGSAIHLVDGEPSYLHVERIAGTGSVVDFPGLSSQEGGTIYSNYGRRAIVKATNIVVRGGSLFYNISNTSESAISPLGPVDLGGIQLCGKRHVLVALVARVTIRRATKVCVLVH